MSEGITFDPTTAAASAAKAKNPKIDMSLDDIIKNQDMERRAARAAKKSSSSPRSSRKPAKEERSRDAKSEKKPQRDSKDSGRPKQIDIDESSIRKFLQLQKVHYPKDCTLKVIAYPRH